jgi:metallophosphoesterase superfamily enzyme
MTAAPLHLAGQRLLLDPLGGVMWREHGVLIVADMHLEKGSAIARRGQLVPPWDTGATLDRLALLLRRHRPRTVVALATASMTSTAPGAWRRPTRHGWAR